MLNRNAEMLTKVMGMTTFGDAATAALLPEWFPRAELNLTPNLNKRRQADQMSLLESCRRS